MMHCAVLYISYVMCLNISVRLTVNSLFKCKVLPAVYCIVFHQKRKHYGMRPRGHSYVLPVCYYNQFKISFSPMYSVYSKFFSLVRFPPYIGLYRNILDYVSIGFSIIWCSTVLHGARLKCTTVAFDIVNREISASTTVILLMVVIFLC